MYRRSFLQTLAGAGVFSISGCGSRRDLRAAFVTDIHWKSSSETDPHLDRCADALRAAKPDLVVCGGDLIHRGLLLSEAQAMEGISTMKSFFASLRVPCLFCLGNHDLFGAFPEDGSPPAPDPRRLYREHFCGLDTCYTQTILGRTWIVLDTLELLPVPQRYRGFIAPERLEWLDKKLSETDSSLCVPVLHVPALSTLPSATKGAYEPVPHNLILHNGAEVVKIFSRSRVPVVLQGHLHVSEKNEWQGRTYLTGGAVCGAWWNGDHHGTPQGFTLLHWRGHNLHTEYRPFSVS